MEQFKNAEFANVKRFTDRIGVLLIGLLVSASVLLTIFKHWRGYDGISKFIAVVLISYLLIPAATAIRGKSSEASKPDRAQIAMWGYMSLMLATILFGMR
jgi:hypothetical protein